MRGPFRILDWSFRRGPIGQTGVGMRISGFTFVRNAVSLDYPVVESIRSILPIVDEFVVALGESGDGTLDLIQSIGSPKIRIVPSTWNPNVKAGGYILAQQTNVALFNCTGEWAIYLQADEAIHEKDHATLIEIMHKYQRDDRIEGLLLRRLSFYGDYRTLVNVHPFFADLSCRVVKPDRFVLSRGDAAGFTVHPKYKEKGRRIRVVDTGLDFFHYADVRSPKKSEAFRDEKRQFWQMTTSGTSPTDAAEANVNPYYRQTLRQFVTGYDGGHPQSMHNRIRAFSEWLDHDSPNWRRTPTPSERKTIWRTKLIRVFGYGAATGRSSRKIIERYQERPFPR